MCRVWTGRDGRAVMALVADCCSRELLGWRLSRSGKAKTAESALVHALIARFGTLGRVDESLLLRSDNGFIFTSHKLCFLGAQLWFAARVHYAAYAATERIDRALDPDNTKRAMRSWPPFRNAAACKPRYWRLNRFLQPPATASVERHKNACRSFCFSSVS